MVDLKHKNIIVTFLMHLGDLVLLTPFLEVLRRNASGSRIVLVADEKVADVARYSPYIDKCVTVDKKGKDNSIMALWHIARRLHKEERPDIVLNLHPNERTSFLAWAIGARETVGMSHFLFRPFMKKVTRLDRIHLHAADMYIDVLKQLGISDIENHGLSITCSKEWEEAADRFYAQEGVGEKDKIIGFNIGSAVQQKRWEPKRFAQAADYFADKGYKIIFFGGTMDKEMVQEAVGHMKYKPMIGTGKFSIGELAAAIRRCCLFITNDSGPMHIAISQKVPVVALYGPSNPMLYGPYTSRAVVLESMTAYETGKSMKKIIREGKYAGINVIPVERVLQGAESLLQSAEK